MHAQQWQPNGVSVELVAKGEQIATSSFAFLTRICLSRDGKTVRLLSSQLTVLEWSQQEKNRTEKSPIQAALHHLIKEPT